jgi:hypothetical protein
MFAEGISWHVTIKPAPNGTDFPLKWYISEHASSADVNHLFS